MSDENSWTSFAAGLQVGHSKYVQITLKSSSRVVQEVSKELSSSFWLEKFRVGIFTCVSADNAGDVRYLLCVERLS